MATFTEFPEETKPRPRSTEQSARETDEPRKSEAIDAAIIEASGRACEGLGRAVAAPSKKGMTSEAQELATQLKYMSKSLGWMLKEVNARQAPSINPPTTKVGINGTRGT